MEDSSFTISSNVGAIASSPINLLRRLSTRCKVTHAQSTLYESRDSVRLHSFPWPPSQTETMTQLRIHCMDAQGNMRRTERIPLSPGVHCQELTHVVLRSAVEVLHGCCMPSAPVSVPSQVCNDDSHLTLSTTVHDPFPLGLRRSERLKPAWRTRAAQSKIEARIGAAEYDTQSWAERTRGRFKVGLWKMILQATAVDSGKTYIIMASWDV